MENQTFIWLPILFIAILLGCSPASQNPVFTGGFIDGKHLLTLHFENPLTSLPTASEIQIQDQAKNIREIATVKPGKNENEVLLTLAAELDIKRSYFIQIQGQQKRLLMNGIYRNSEFYDLNSELGANYSPSATTFRLFAPRATKVTLNIYQNPVMTVGEKGDHFNLTEKSGGIWEIVVPGNLAGKYYTYNVESVAPDCHRGLEIVDPYAKIVTRGDGRSLQQREGYFQTIGRGMIIDFGRTGTVAEINDPEFHIAQAIIYETHIRDFTRDHNSGIAENKKGLFAGAAETGTRYKSLATGLDHLVELGVNVVQFHPLNEFWVMDENTNKHKYVDYKDKNKHWHQAEYYNWGYAPINYFSVEGWYAANPDNLSRIRELKTLISNLHQHGIRVTLDVVFNHTFEGSRENFAHWLFRGIDTDYYYRSFANGDFCDGIYCGNEIKTENPMAAKYLIDCLKYWVTEFKVDGFRFDWMSAIDPATMNRLVRELRHLNPNILLYGELWTLRGLSYAGKNTGTYVDRQHIGQFERDYDLPPGSIAGFNDYFRDAVKGSGFQRDYSGGYIQNISSKKFYNHRPAELVKKTIKGMVDFTTLSNDSNEWQNIRSPLNSINYIACHDGFTLYDKLILAAFCQYQKPGQPDSPQKHYPRSSKNPKVIDFTDRAQFPDADIENTLRKMDKLGAAILLTSQGIPFVHSGMEMLRQKIKCYPSQDSPTGEYFEFDSNSNTSPDAVNAIQWDLKEKNYDVFKYYQGLIRLRREHPTFRRTTAASVRQGLTFHDEWLPPESESCIAYQLISNNLPNETRDKTIVLINPYPEAKQFNIPKEKWEIVVDDQQAGVNSLRETPGGMIKVAGISMMVLYQ